MSRRGEDGFNLSQCLALDQVLGLEGNATIATEVSLWDGVEVTPGGKVYDAELERKKMEEEADGEEEMEGVEPAAAST